MQFQFCLSAFALIGLAAADPACPTKSIALNDLPWRMLPFSANPNAYCTFSFIVPSGYYAVMNFTGTGVSTSDHFKLGDNIGDYYELGYKQCDGTCQDIRSITSWPTNFTLTYYTGSVTKMKLQFTVTTKPLKPSAKIVGTYTTGNNTDSPVVYLKGIKQGTSYTVTSPTFGSPVIRAAIDFKTGDMFERSEQNNIFVFDGPNLVGTLNSVSQFGLSSRTKSFTFFAATDITLTGAILATDYANIRDLTQYGVMYVPVNHPNASATAFVQGGFSSPEDGAVTIIGEKDGSTPITVRQLSSFGSPAPSFSFNQGGPLSGHKSVVSPLSNSMLPKTFQGNVNTFYVSQGEANIKFTINKTK